MSAQNLLVELFVEELPPKALKNLGGAFARVLLAELKHGGLLDANCKVEIFATPRRLAARFSSVQAKAADRQTDERLLPEKVGLTADGNATPALIKKLTSMGRDESALALIKKVNDGKMTMLATDRWLLQPALLTADAHRKNELKPFEI